MPESTARAERFETQSPARPFYVWEVLQKPVSVRICLDVVERLEHDVTASFRSVSNRGSEIGGLLLGRVVPGPRPTISVEDYEPVACDYSRGPLYRLSENDRANLDDAVRRRTGADRELAVVGVFRSNTRKELSADPDDLALMKGRFHLPEQVLLLVKPFATKPALAGFFIWEEGAIRETSHLEFPFTRAALVAGHGVRAFAVEPVPALQEAAGQPPAEGRAPEPSPAPETPAPKAAGRGQVVPIASRRDVAAAPPAAAEPEQPAAVEAAPATPEPAAPAAAAETAVAKAPEFAPLKTPEFAAPPAGEGRGKLVWILCGAAAALLALVLLVYPGLLVRTGPAPTGPEIDTSSLALRVERSAGQLLLTWNREAEAVKSASRAVLTISDGPQQENVELDLAQLRNGSVVYTPATADVGFRLELTGANQGTSRSEHVRVLGAKPSPMAVPELAKSAAPKPQAAAPMPEAVETAEALPASAAPARPRESLSAKWNEQASLGQRLRPALPSDLPEPPSLGRAAGLGSQSPAGIPMGLSRAPAAPVPAPPPPAAAQSAQASDHRVGGQVQEAVLVSRREPGYPPLAKQSRVQGIVHLEATVARDGKVTGVKVVSGHPLLREAAAEAVKHWIYRPALLNGQAVEVTTRVSVGFSMQ
jgi:TonB family protein